MTMDPIRPVPFDSGVSVLVTDRANVDWPAPLIYVIGTPPQLAFQVPATTAPGVAMITVTNERWHYFAFVCSGLTVQLQLIESQSDIRFQMSADDRF
jgi:uncharacterized protein (TIGR03437 family)